MHLIGVVDVGDEVTSVSIYLMSWVVWVLVIVYVNVVIVDVSGVDGW